ncbi:MAG: hypothetical protein HY811_02165 [Planctomycetes bacterium]|nr:hypothetical protein [Planctomycetota bacterium]
MRKMWTIFITAFLVINAFGIWKIISVIEREQKFLVVKSFTPDGPADRNEHVIIRFNKEVVDSTAAGKDLPQPYPVKFTPEIAGQCRWTDTRTLEFTPSEPLCQATEYTAELLSSLRALDNSPLPEKAVYTFSTGALGLERVWQVAVENNRTVVIALEFSDEVAPADLATHLKIENAQGINIDYSLAGLVNNKTPKVKIQVAQNETVKIKVAKGLTGKSGPLGLDEDVERMLNIEMKLAVTDVTAYPLEEYESGWIRVEFSTPVSPDVAADFISIEPPVKFLVEEHYYENNLALHGEFNPSSVYKLTFAKGLTALNNMVLTEDVSRIVEIPDCPRNISFKSNGIYASLKGNLILPIVSMNNDSIVVKAERVYPNNVIHFARNFREEYSSIVDFSYEIAEVNIPIKSEKNKAVEIPLDLKALLGDKLTGPTVIKVYNSEYKWDSQRKLILVTDLGVCVKKSGNDFLVWVNSLSDVQPVEGAIVSVYNRKNQVILEGKTARDGIMHFMEVDWAKDNEPYIVIVTHGDDMSYLKLEQCKLSDTDFDVGGRSYLSKGYEAYLYTDRGVYRPGEEMHLRAIVRSANNELPAGLPLELQIEKPDKRPLRRLKAVLSDFATVEFGFTIPDYAPTGYYTTSLYIPGESKPIGYCSFSVEEYMPVRLKAEVKAPAERFHTGETITFTVKSNYLFGQPASGLNVSANYTVKPDNYQPPDNALWKDYTFGDQTKGFTNIKEKIAPLKLGANGEGSFAIKVPEKLQPPSGLLLTVYATVKEVGGRGVTTGTRIRMDPYPYYIGLKQASEVAGSGIRFEAIAVTPEGKLISGEKALNIVLKKVVWNTVLKKSSGDRYRYESVRTEVDVGKPQMITTDDGKIEFTLNPEESGSYIVRVSGPKDNVVTALEFYNSPQGYLAWSMEKPEQIDLVPDKGLYQVGEVAKVLVKSPCSGQMLVFVESDRVLSSQSIQLDGNTAELRIPIGEGFAPTVYCSVTVVKGVEKGGIWSAHRAYGVVPLNVDAPGNRLKVSLEIPNEIVPLTKLTIPITVKNEKGEGVEAEVVIAALDEGICLLTDFKNPDPYSFFFAKKRLSTEMFDFYSLLLPEYEKKNVGSDSEEGGSGEPGLMQSLLNPINAKRVKSVALWSGTVKTNPDGTGEIVFDVPEFIGSLRLMVVAVTRDKYGCDSRNLLVRRPFIISSSLPRFLSTGDSFSAPLTLYNNIASETSALIRISVDGPLGLAGANETSVIVPPNGQQTIYFTFNASDSPGVSHITFSAQVNGETLKEETELPVRPLAPPVQFVGSGSIPAGKSAVFSFPSGLMSGTDTYTLNFSVQPSLRLGGAINYLLHYPYGCVEQTASGTFPLLYLADIAKQTMPNCFIKQEVAEYVQSGIYRLLSMQTFNGGLSMWPGGTTPYEWGSVYGAHLLVEAKKNGYSVPEKELKALINYLKELVKMSRSSRDEESDNLSIKAYAHFVLALAGEPEINLMKTLRNYWDKLPVYSRYQLASALALAGEPKALSELIGTPVPEPGKRQDTGGILASPVRETAIILSVLADTAPESAAIPILVNRLNQAMENGCWYNTQENAFALLALGKYAHAQANIVNDFTAEVRFDGKEIASFAHKESPSLDILSGGGKEITVSVKGEGRLYYYWTAQGVPLSKKVDEDDKGLKIRRSFLSTDGKQLAPGQFKSGEIVIVQLIIESPDNRDNVAVVDALPAGLEIENPRLVTSEQTEWMSSARENKLFPDRVEMRDDRLILFTDLPGSKSMCYYYVTRAVTAGKFMLAPVNAFCMYQPSIKSVNGAGIVEVKK